VTGYIGEERLMSLEDVVETDVLVIGGGIAGCFAAIKAREQGLNVSIVDKAYAGKSGASVAAGMGYMGNSNQNGERK
jgi:succinate dehydrogenase/fumarate reductase flavoprotein subunit